MKRGEEPASAGMLWWKKNAGKVAHLSSQKPITRWLVAKDLPPRTDVVTWDDDWNRTNTTVHRTLQYELVIWHMAHSTAYYMIWHAYVVRKEKFSIWDHIITGRKPCQVNCQTTIEHVEVIKSVNATWYLETPPPPPPLPLPPPLPPLPPLLPLPPPPLFDQPFSRHRTFYNSSFTTMLNVQTQ